MLLTQLGTNGKGDPIIGWDPVLGCVGYRFQSAGNYPNWSHTWNPSLDRVTFKKGATPYRVQAVAVADEGLFPPLEAPLPFPLAPIT